MSAKFIRRIVDVGIAIFSIVGFLLIGRAVAAMFEGDFGTLHWPVQASALEMASSFGGGAAINFHDGVLTVANQPLWHGVDLAFSLVGIGILIATLMILRTVLVSFATGDLVNTGNANSLRKIGLLLLVACALSAVHALVLQPAILAAVNVPEGAVLHPSISWDVSGMTNIWLHYDVPVFTFVLGGLALLFSEAFRAGTAYREDSESVV